MGPEARKFYLFNAALALALAAMAVVLRAIGPGLWQMDPALAMAFAPLTFAGVSLALVACYLLRSAFGHDSHSLLRLGAAGIAVAVVLDAAALHGGEAAGPLPAGGLLHILNAVTSAWLAGSILLAMTLGHFYLVIPSLSINPLRNLFRFSLAGLLLRVLLVSTAGALWWFGGGRDAIDVALFLRQGVFVLQRVLFGLAIPVSLAYFTWKTIEMRSTQSATGILYVVVFLTLVGEALSVYLSLETAIPI